MTIRETQATQATIVVFASMNTQPGWEVFTTYTDEEGTFVSYVRQFSPSERTAAEAYETALIAKFRM